MAFTLKDESELNTFSTEDEVASGSFVEKTSEVEE